MTRLIIAKTSDGQLHACDARCYNSKGDRCQCICGGLNHGYGLFLGLTNIEHLNRLISKAIKIRFPKVTSIHYYQPKEIHTFHAPQPNPHQLPSSPPPDQ